MPQSEQRFSSVFQTANLRRRQVSYQRWHRNQTKCYILRTQLGFARFESSRPAVCRGCCHYHGKAYGQPRILFTCSFHPYGWSSEPPCPDWQDKISHSSL